MTPRCSRKPLLVSTLDLIVLLRFQVIIVIIVMIVLVVILVVIKVMIALIKSDNSTDNSTTTVFKPRTYEVIIVLLRF